MLFELEILVLALIWSFGLTKSKLIPKTEHLTQEDHHRCHNSDSVDTYHTIELNMFRFI